MRSRLAQKLAEHGLRLPHGGTDTHLMLVDCKTIVGPDGTRLKRRYGGAHSRPDRNRAQPPDDPRRYQRPAAFGHSHRHALDHSARLSAMPRSTRWPTLSATVLKACVPFSYSGRIRPQARAKIDFDVLQAARLRVRDLAASVGIDTDASDDEYPHVQYLDADLPETGWHTFAVQGELAAGFLAGGPDQQCCRRLKPGEQQAAYIWDTSGSGPLSRVIVEAAADGYRLHVERQAGRIASWLRSLSDGFIIFDPADVYAKVPGPVRVVDLGPADTSQFKLDLKTAWDGDAAYGDKAYFIGLNHPAYDGPQPDALPEFIWEEPAQTELLTTPLHSLHQELGAKMVEFAGYDMPVWYSSVKEEHQAVRTQAGIFDVTHMGAFEASGRGAAAFLNALTTNDLDSIAVGELQYTYLLDTQGLPFDDLMIYRLDVDDYLLVVNASNNDKNWAWLNAVLQGSVCIDPAHPGLRLENRDQVTLRDLRAPESGADRRVDIALQGPQSKQISEPLERQRRRQG